MSAADRRVPGSGAGGSAGRGAPRRTGRGLVAFTFDGRPLTAERGQSVAAALLAAGIRSWRTTRNGGAPRGLFCGIGICFDCLVTVDGRPGVRACLTEVHQGAAVETQHGAGHAAFDR